jgi:regulator of protease activity HflC (stomatin/prohibitin superfamily)
MASRGLLIICSIVSLTVLVTIILIASSLSVLSYNEVGLNYSNWFKTVEEKTYYHGIQFIGLGHSFQRYDIKLNTIEFSKAPDATLPMIKCRTKDGLELDLEASLQYRVEPESIFKIYTSYGTQEKAILTRVILDIISDTSTKYTSNDFFTRRSVIQQAMTEDLRAQVLAQTWHEVRFFQLRSLALPDEYEKEIQNTEVKGQDIIKSNKERDREQVKFDTNVLVAELAVNATLETAYGTGNKTVYEAEATATTVKAVIDAQAEAYATMKKNNTLDND